ncbi:hypothetical protein DXM29_04590 [Agrobacterium tumefaciens]|nr:hypothetical protein DXM29_04590 [Agrobacterium tumefaciens]
MQIVRRLAEPLERFDCTRRREILWIRNVFPVNAEANPTFGPLVTLTTRKLVSIAVRLSCVDFATIAAL